MEEIKETLATFSMWFCAYAITQGIQIVRVFPGQQGKLGWVLDNTDGKAEAALGVWREGIPIVNGQELLSAHYALMDEVRRYA